ncbi:MAG TPA: cell division protein FtsA [Fimbriimonadaceae bacterium]|nr:cell division protein FtsA [Fimbriimonadaceae bacterium]HRJ33196.1 cell division protein FtsA [Fimbriimonadaceae bacterium]
MKERNLFVLDIGSTKVACLAIAVTPEGEMEIAGAGVAPQKGMQRGVVTDLESTAMAISDAVRQAQQQAGFSGSGLLVSVGGPHVEGVNTQGIVPIYPRSRPINRDDILQVINHSRQVMMPPDREMIQALPREFRVDGQRGVKKPIGMSGSKLEVFTYILTGQTTHLSNLDRAVQLAGYRIDQMVFGPLATAAAVMSPEEQELGCVLVDLGGGTTDVGVYSGGTLVASACIPIGGQHVTNDLSKLLKTSPEEAERLKVRFGAAMGAGVSEDDSVDVLQIGQSQPRPMARKVLCEIIESRMREIALIVRQQIEKSGLNGLLPAGVVLTGGGAEMEKTPEVFESVLKHMRARLGSTSVEGPHAELLNRPGMATVIGLAKVGAESEEDVLAPAHGLEHWKEKFRSLKSIWSK